MRNIVTKEILAEMVNDYHNGVGLVELSENYGFQEQTIQKHLRKLGLVITKSKAKKFSKDELDDIISDYKSGMKPCELANKYNRNSGVIINKLQSIGIYEKTTHRFTTEEINLLKKYYPIGDWDSIKKYLQNISKESIYTKMNELGISMVSHFWSDDDELLLKRNYESMYGHITELIDLFKGKYTYSAIISKARKLGLKTREFWSEKEIDIIKKYYSNTSIDEIIKLLPNRKRDSIISKAKDLGYRNCCKYQDWEVQFIIDNWKSIPDKELADILSKSYNSLVNKRLSLRFLRKKDGSSYNDLSEYVRRNNWEWKKESIISCGYKCTLTGNRFDEIHHIHGLNLILNETLAELNIEIKKSMGDYSEKELRNILDLFRIKQSTYPLGVCLSKDVHMLFHNKYGYGSNTEEQWNEFVKNFKNGKYNKELKIA